MPTLYERAEGVLMLPQVDVSSYIIYIKKTKFCAALRASYRITNMNLELHAGQSRIVSDLFVEQSCRYAVVCASRGFGKSYLAATTAILAVQELMQLGPEVPNKNVAIIAPTYSQCVDIYFPLLAYQFGLADYADKHSAHSGTFWFPNDVVLKLWSYEASERMRGSGQYFVVCDEVTSWRGAGSTLKESWESVVQPCITTRWSRQNSERVGAAAPGRALIISTPQGHDTFYDMYNNEERDSEWKSYHFTYHDSPYLDPVEIEKTKHTIDHLKFQREYEASFEDSGNTVFYNFKRANNVRNDLEYFKKDEDVHVAIDFNVGEKITPTQNSVNCWELPMGQSAAKLTLGRV